MRVEGVLKRVQFRVKFRVAFRVVVFRVVGFQGCEVLDHGFQKNTEEKEGYAEQ